MSDKKFCQKYNRDALIWTPDFFQELEGEEVVINELYAQIEKDSRHKDCTLIEKQTITEREFPYWSMGFEK